MPRLMDIVMEEIDGVYWTPSIPDTHIWWRFYQAVDDFETIHYATEDRFGVKSILTFPFYATYGFNVITKT